MGMAFLDYHDILLRDEDVNLLRGPEWLNDQVGPPVNFCYVGYEVPRFPFEVHAWHAAGNFVLL